MGGEISKLADCSEVGHGILGFPQIGGPFKGASSGIYKCSITVYRYIGVRVPQNLGYFFR